MWMAPAAVCIGASVIRGVDRTCEPRALDGPRIDPRPGQHLLAHPHQNLGPRPRVVQHVPLELLQVVKPAPHVLVHLHKAYVSGGALKPRHPVVASYELPPTALLPRHAL